MSVQDRVRATRRRENKRIEAMSSIKAITTCQRKCASFKGRVSRSEFCWFALLVPVGLLAAGRRAARLIKACRRGQDDPRPDAPVLVWLFATAPAFPGAGTRRARDGGWWNVLVLRPLLLFLLLAAFLTILVAGGGFDLGIAIPTLLPFELLLALALAIFLACLSASGNSHLGSNPHEVPK